MVASQAGMPAPQLAAHVAEISRPWTVPWTGAPVVSYGCCACCGNDIGEARLEELPAAERCITCATSGRR